MLHVPLHMEGTALCLCFCLHVDVCTTCKQAVLPSRTATILCARLSARRHAWSTDCACPCRLEGRSVFFTGHAGTGKSLLLKHLVHALPPESTFVTGKTVVQHMWHGRPCISATSDVSGCGHTTLGSCSTASAACWSQGWLPVCQHVLHLPDLLCPPLYAVLSWRQPCVLKPPPPPPPMAAACAEAASPMWQMLVCCQPRPFAVRCSLNRAGSLCSGGHHPECICRGGPCRGHCGTTGQDGQQAQCAAEVAASQDPHCRRGQSRQAWVSIGRVVP